MKQVEVRLCFEPAQTWPVGRLAEVGRRRYFEYDASFLARGLALSPFRLPLQAGAIEHRDREFGPLPGVFEDSLPDGWGRLLMDRHFRQQGQDPAAVSVLDRLLWLGCRTLGALTYHPATPGEAAALDLQSLLRQATEIHAGEASVVLPQLLRAGGSPGGARPKVLVGLRQAGPDDVARSGSETVYSGDDELPDAGPLEQAYALMARAAGIKLPTTRLIAVGPHHRCFAVQRFDRLPGQQRLQCTASPAVRCASGGTGRDRGSRRVSVNALGAPASSPARELHADEDVGVPWDPAPPRELLRAAVNDAISRWASFAEGGRLPTADAR